MGGSFNPDLCLATVQGVATTYYVEGVDGEENDFPINVWRIGASPRRFALQQWEAGPWLVTETFAEAMVSVVADIAFNNGPEMEDDRAFIRQMEQSHGSVQAMFDHIAWEVGSALPKPATT